MNSCKKKSAVHHGWSFCKPRAMYKTALRQEMGQPWQFQSKDINVNIINITMKSTECMCPRRESSRLMCVNLWVATCHMRSKEFQWCQSGNWQARCGFCKQSVQDRTSVSASLGWCYLLRQTKQGEAWRHVASVNNHQRPRCVNWISSLGVSTLKSAPKK